MKKIVLSALFIIAAFCILQFLVHKEDAAREFKPDINALQAVNAPALANASQPLRKPAGMRQKAQAARQRIAAGQRDAAAARARISESLLDKFAANKDRLNRTNAPPMQTQPRGYGWKVLDPLQQQSIDVLRMSLGPGAELQMDAALGTLRHLRGNLAAVVEGSPSFVAAQARGDYGAMAVATTEAIAQVMNLQNPSQELVPQQPDRDDLGMVHVKLDQRLGDFPVYSAQVIVHFDSNGQPVEVQGAYAPTPVHSTLPAEEISEPEALSRACAAVGMSDEGPVAPQIARKYYWDPNNAPILAYHVVLTPSVAQRWHVFVSAASGTVVKVLAGSYSEAVVGQSVDLLGRTKAVHSWKANNDYLAIDTSLPMYDNTRSQPPSFTNIFGAICIFDVKNQDVDEALKTTGVEYARASNKDQWDPAVASVMDHFTRIYNYYKTTHNRNSFDDKGINMTVLIHAQFKDSSGNLYKDNAFFNPGGNYMVFGDGEKYSDPGMFPAALDIAAHELTHGVVDNSAAFRYENQSGALHEHMADYFGCMIDRDDWLNGEDIYAVSHKKAGGRDLSNPANPNVDSPGPKNMSEYQNLPNTPQGDLGGVHVNSTIPSYGCYLFTEGPGGMGRDKAEKIVYRALTKYMTPNSQFVDYRRALLSAANDLFPGGTEANTIKQAFDNIGILDGSATPTPTPVPATSGQEYILFLRAEYEFDPWDPFGEPMFMGYSLRQQDPQGNFQLVAQRYLSGVRPAISGSGTWALYVGSDQNVYWTDGIQEEQWTDTSDVRTIAMSKDHHYIAFTTTDYDNTITLLDTTTESTRTGALTIPTSGDPVNLGYADVLTFNCLNDFLFFDAWTEGNLNQTEYGCWGLYSMRVKDLVCQTVLPLTPGLQVGNPSLSNTKGFLLVADYIYQTNQQKTLGVVCLDTDKKQMGILLKGLNIVAAPTFRGDDKKIVFQLYENGTYYLREAALTSDLLGLVQGSIQGLVWSDTELSYPVGFRSGTYTPPAGQLVVEPNSVDFAEVPIGQTASKQLVLRNAGNADLDLIEATLEGADIAVFDFASTIQKRISAGQSQSLNLAFTPAKAALASVTLRAKTTVPGQADVLVNIKGTGKAQAGSDMTQHWRTVWQDFQNTYSYFDYKGINWSNVYNQYASEFANITADGFAEKINSIFQMLHDWHVAVKKPDGTYIGYNGTYTKNCSGKLFGTYTGGISYSNVNKASVIYHAWVDHDIAHILVDTLSNGAFDQISDADIEAIFQKYASAAGMIVDIRDNSGGNEANAAKFASRFTDSPRTFGHVRYRTPNVVPYQFEPFIAKVLEPSTATHFRKPVVGLVGRRCMSSAEWFTLMLKSCPNVVLIGDRTRGASGSPTTKGIPAINIEYEICTWMAFDDQQEPFEDRGIDPAISIPADQSYDDSAQKDYVLERAIAYIRWRQNQPSTLVNVSGNSDFDHDRQLDVHEYLAGTSPTDPKSWFGFKAYQSKLAAGGGVVLQWSSADGFEYTIHRTSNLSGGFTVLKPGIAATPPLNSYTDSTANRNRNYYYRIEMKKK